MIALLLFFSFVFGEPNPPHWPGNVYVFEPGSSATQGVVNRIFAENGGHTPAFNGQFSNSRYALLFKPGTHNVMVNVGFYTSVIGLGNSPTDTTIGTIKVENGDFEYTGGALDNFWRSVENFATGNTLWAVSQACPMRRVVIRGNLDLFQYNSGCCAGYASGGYLADSEVTGTVTSGSQQQWFTRNSKVGRWNGGVWNMVFVGVNGAPGSHCGDTGGNPYTTIAQTPVIAEKPYITIKPNGAFSLRIPHLETNKVGPTTNYGNADDVDFEKVFVANDTIPASLINSKIASGLHVVLSPGNYKLTESIVVNNPNTVILGIGFPTLISPGAPAIKVGNVDGVRIAGVLLQAGPMRSSSLLQIGEMGYKGSAQNPTHIYDIFARIGGPDRVEVSADVAVLINSGNVVFDNSWLWRADHDVNGNVVNSQNPCNNGLVVNGDDVIAYSLAVEHHLKDLVVWNGERGRTYFYQSELPYDVTQANYGAPGYVGYKVSPQVTQHHAWAIGVYSFFRDADVTTVNGITSPTGAGIQFIAPFSKFLSGMGEISHVWNNRGTPSNSKTNIAYLC
jgi:hypothetical protein